MDRRNFCIKVVEAGFASELLVGLASAGSADVPRKLEWQSSMKAAHKLSVESNKPMLIVFCAVWCQPCKRLERETLSNETVIAAIDREFIPVHLDFDRDMKVRKILEVEAVPCTIALSPEADLLQRSVGFSDTKAYLKFLRTSLAKHAEIRQQNVTYIPPEPAQ